MGLVTTKPKTTTGVQVSGSSPWRAIARSGSFKHEMDQSESSFAAPGHKRDPVSDVLRQPAVTVLLQSVRQIRTVNEEFLSSLTKAVDEHSNIGDVIERFAGVMPVYSTFATHHPFVLEELTTTRAEAEELDTRLSPMKASSSSGGLDTLLTACEMDSRCLGMNLRTLMNLPLERVGFLGCCCWCCCFSSG